MNTNIVISPGKYIQGYGELERIESHVSFLGNAPFIVASPSGMRLTRDIVENSFKNKGKNCLFELFNRECSKNEINRLKELCEKNNCDFIIGIGGGKALDTAKALAFYMEMPVVIVPTIASTDAPCSALSVLYTDEGAFEEYLILPTNPSVVLVDTKVVVNAPVRLLVAGMGDALATYFEARACKASNSKTMTGALTSTSAMALAKLCYDTLINEGLKAKLAVEKKVCTSSVEKIIEANTYLSGIGFESGGLGAAHAIHNGFTVLEECHNLYHGEKVAFGTLTQLVLENASTKEIEEVMSFCVDVGLPITLEDLGIEEINKEALMRVAEASAVEGETIHNMPFDVTADDVYAAILTADSLGKLFKGN